MPIPFPFDFKNPDYIMVCEWREENYRRLKRDMAEDPLVLDRLFEYYKNNIAQFIIDWGMTEDPRLIAEGLPAEIPFLLFPKQEEFVYWVIDHWKAKKHRRLFGVKSRDWGASEVLMAIFDCLGLFYRKINLGVGSRKREYVDSLENPDSLLYKSRRFIKYLPIEFRQGWKERTCSKLMQVKFPRSKAIITGEAGDGFGRGGRKSIYGVDESAFIERARALEFSLSRNTDLRIDISTPNGPNNPFAQNVKSGRYPIFYMHWSDDPRRGPEWYAAMCEEIGDPAIIAQELDHNFEASIEGIIIPPEWVKACVDAHIKLGLKITGIRKGSLDVADEGKDKNAFISGQGILIDFMAQWTGKGSDVYETTRKALEYAELVGCQYVVYDSDGLGAGVRGDIRALNAIRKTQKVGEFEFLPFRGSGEVLDKEKEVWPAKPGTPLGRGLGRKNEDYFGNAKAQAWFQLARRCRNTFKAVVENQPYDPKEIMSISSSCTDYLKLVQELSQPIRYQSEDGKMYVDKTPDGMPSPNYGDACMMYFAKLQQRPRNILDVR